MDEAQQRKYQAVRKIHEKAREFRGGFLNSVAVIERNIAKILTEYFCTGDELKRELFFNKVAEKLSLEKKKQILIEIAKNDYPKYWDDNQKFLKDLQKIQEFRNKLAHSVVDVSEEAIGRPLDEGIGFIQWNKGEPVTEDELNDWEVEANMLSSTLTDIKRLLSYKERGKEKSNG